MIFAFKKPGIPLFFQASLDFNSFCWPWRGVASITAPLQGVLSSNPRLGDPQMDGWMVHHVGGVGWSFKPTERAWTPPLACGAPLKAPRQGDGAHVPASRAPSAIPGAAEGTSASLSSTSRESRGSRTPRGCSQVLPCAGASPAAPAVTEIRTKCSESPQSLTEKTPRRSRTRTQQKTCRKKKKALEAASGCSSSNKSFEIY